jgi:hypothetical protein
MKMITNTIDPHHFNQKTQQIKAQVSTVLKKWGLLPRFARWRLTQDPSTGMKVLFGILNNGYIAAHTSTPFSDYFDPRVLHDLADELQLQVVSCNSDGLRYAFILDRGQIDRLPTFIDFPFIDNGKLSARVIYSGNPQSGQSPIPDNLVVDDPSLVHQSVRAFLKVFDDIKLKHDAALIPPVQNLPDIVIIDKEEFNKRVAEHEANRQKGERIRKLFDKTA